MKTTSYETMKKEYDSLFRAYRIAHQKNFRNDNKQTRSTLREAISSLNACDFVNRNI